MLVLSDALNGEHDSAFADHERLALTRILSTLRIEAGEVRTSFLDLGGETAVDGLFRDAHDSSCGRSRLVGACGSSEYSQRCPGRDLNPHRGCPPGGFKPPASTDSATRA